MITRWCVACGDEFTPCPQVPQQAFCGKDECRRERRRLWQIAKRQTDPDYVDNQAKAQQAWAQRHPGYWRDYRSKNPAYVERNRAQQKMRNQAIQRTKIAKKAQRPAPRFLEPGLYQLRLVDANGVAKSDAWTVHIEVLRQKRLS